LVQELAKRVSIKKLYKMINLLIVFICSLGFILGFACAVATYVAGEKIGAILYLIAALSCLTVILI
jgi:hypothetical protein